MIYVFGEYELDTGLYELRRAGMSYKVEPKAFDLLIYLITHRDRVVTREELFERVWSDPFISEAILSHHIMVARKAVSDDGRAQRMIKTSTAAATALSLGSMSGSSRPLMSGKLNLRHAQSLIPNRHRHSRKMCQPKMSLPGITP